MFRNTPLLLQVLFWSAILLKLPAIRQAFSLGDWVFLSQRGLQIPVLAWSGDAMWWPAVAGAVCCGLIGRLLSRRWVIGVAVGVVVLFVVWWAQGALSLERPVRKLFGFSGGFTLTPEFCALLPGWWPTPRPSLPRSFAAASWRSTRPVGGGAQPRPARRFDHAPHRAAPGAADHPAGDDQPICGDHQELQLAVAIGYPDLFWSISTAINVTGHAIEGVVVMMAGYLVLALGTAGAMNSWYRRMLRQGAQ